MSIDAPTSRGVASRLLHPWSRPHDHRDHATLRAEEKSSRRWLRAIGTLVMAALFTAGIVYMMMTLAGYFEPKVKPVAARDAR